MKTLHQILADEVNNSAFSEIGILFIDFCNVVF